jgi:small-conductance mechanosensitive channel
MSYNWGPHYIVPTKVLKSYSGAVVLREEFDEELLRKEFEALGITGPIAKITNPWYYRRKGTDTWVKIGESADEHRNFPTRWDTTSLKNGQYEVMGLMHIFVKKNGTEIAIARQNVAEVTVQN